MFYFFNTCLRSCQFPIISVCRLREEASVKYFPSQFQKNERLIAGYSGMGSRKRAQSLRGFTLWH